MRNRWAGVRARAFVIARSSDVSSLLIATDRSRSQALTVLITVSKSGARFPVSQRATTGCLVPNLRASSS